jgi:hypothetical protein
MKTDAESRPFRTQLIPGSTEERPHTVFVARVPRGKGEEKWVIDTTGSQYGFREVLVPYKKYSKEKASALANPLTASNAGINKDLDEYVRDPRLCWHEQQVANLLADRHTRQHFATFIANCADDDFLFGPDDHMKAMCEVFVADLKYYLRKARD